jgi:polyisoprenoid-binding protein YceI
MGERAQLRTILAAALAIAAGAAAAQPVVYRLDPERTRVHWEVLHYGTSTSRGRFDTVTGNVVLDRGARSGEISVTVDTASVSTGLALFDRVLRGANMLDTAAYPQAWFVARRIEFDGDRIRSLRGELTLHGASGPLTLTAERFACRGDESGPGEICGGDFSGELRRSDYGITYGQPFAADRVRLFVTVQGTRD